MRQLILDGAVLNGPELEITERYLKRLQGPWATELIQLKKGAAKQKFNQGTAWVLDPQGKMHSSEELSQLLEEAPTNLQFVVGGSHGPTVDWSPVRRISICPGMLPHKLAVAVFAEQLYRSYTLSIGHPYHHE